MGQLVAALIEFPISNPLFFKYDSYAVFDGENLSLLYYKENQT